jgi:hypothetical protein
MSLGFSTWSRCHRGAYDEKLVGGSGTILATKGSTMGPRGLVPAQTGLEVWLERHQWVHSASGIATMAWISDNWRYILFTPSVLGGGKVLRVLAAMALAWVSSRLAEGATPLARVVVVAKSPLGSAPPRGKARAVMACVVRLCQLFTCRQVCSTIALSPARRWVAQHGHALVAPLEECTIGQRSGWCPVMAPAPVVVLTGVGGAPTPSHLGEGRSEPPPLLEVVWNTAVESSIMARRRDGGPLWVESIKAMPESLLLGERLTPPM